MVTISDLTGDSFRNSFNISLFRNDLTRAFEEFDTDVLYSTLTQITELFAQQPMRYLQAVDGACNILYLALSLLPDGSQTLSQIFASYSDGYRSIYRMNNVEQVAEWLTVLRLSLIHISQPRSCAHLRASPGRDLRSAGRPCCSHRTGSPRWRSPYPQCRRS